MYAYKVTCTNSLLAVVGKGEKYQLQYDMILVRLCYVVPNLIVWHILGMWDRNYDD